MEMVDNPASNDASGSSEFSAEEVIRQMEKILASNAFSHSMRMQTFLRYVVNETLAGRADRLKEYAIAQEVFQKDETFDPKDSSIVRVEANRLRTRIKDYYVSDGSDDELVLEIPKGGYVAIFRTASKEVGIAEQALPASIDPFKSDRRITAVLACMIRSVADPVNSEFIKSNKSSTALFMNWLVPIAANHRGRVLDTKPQDLLFEFTNANDAVLCALAIESYLKDQNSRQPPSAHLFSSIGIDIDEVFVDGDQLFGPAVEEAKKLREVTDGGGVILSGSVHEQLSRQENVECTYVGGQVSVSGERRYRAYRAQSKTTSGSEASIVNPVANAPRTVSKRLVVYAAVALCLTLLLGYGIWNLPNRGDGEKNYPDEEIAVSEAAKRQRSSIAVYPFEDLSTARGFGPYAEALSIEVITRLTKRKGFFVKAHSATHKYRGFKVDVRQFASEMGVRFVVQGQIREIDGMLRISSELVDASTGNNLWADSYNYQIALQGNVLESQEDAAEKIVTSITQHKNLRQNNSESPN